MEVFEMVVNFYVGSLTIYTGKATKWWGGIKFVLILYGREYYRFRKRMRMLRGKLKKKKEL